MFRKFIPMRVLLQGILLAALLIMLPVLLVPEAEAERASLAPQSQPTDAAKRAITFVSEK